MFVAPLQAGFPGGVEIIFFLLMGLFWIVPLVAVVLIVYYLRRIDRNVERLVEERR